MPTLFPDITTYVICALVMAGAQLLYATIGFGAGMFSVALLALILPDLAKPVAVLLVLTFATELWVLSRTWRQARLDLIVGLVPTMIIGMWIGSSLLASGNVALLKRFLGLFVACAGLWFLYLERKTAQGEDSVRQTGRIRRRRSWPSLPVGFASGTLTGMYGTGGPPVIMLVKGYRLDKGAFRATMLAYFMITSFVRGGMYIGKGLLTLDEFMAGVWLLPPALVGTLIGMVAHGRLSERRFARIVSVLLIILGLLLLFGRSKG